MRILSKYKDYYDYLSDIYGVDDKIILDRREGTSYYVSDKVFVIHVLGKSYHGYKKDDKFYYGKDILKLFPHLPIKHEWGTKREYIQINKWEKFFIEPFVDKMTNTKYPIVYGYDGVYPKLIDIGFNKVMDAKTIYLGLTEWLTPKDDFKDTRTNKDKILTNGFDYKHSFRNTK